MVSLAPLLIGSFVFNFSATSSSSSFPRKVVRRSSTCSVPVGATHILITFTFGIAVSAGRGNNYGVGTAITILIFVILVIISRIGFRFTRRLEDIYGGL